MKIHLVSDLHLEFGPMPDTYHQPDCDVVVLAGDIALGVAGIEWAAETFTKLVLYLAGNHEFYRYKLSLYDDLKAASLETKNVRFLNNELVDIDGVRFVGGTLWTDMNLFNNPVQDGLSVSFALNDFRQIGGMNLKAWHDMNRATADFIRANPADVVISHHAPDPGSVPDRFKNDSVSAGYASRLLQSLEQPPRLWLHGHTHDSWDYMVGDTRVVCNPRGYDRYEVNPDFIHDLVIEV